MQNKNANKSGNVTADSKCDICEYMVQKYPILENVSALHRAGEHLVAATNVSDHVKVTQEQRLLLTYVEGYCLALNSIWRLLEEETFKTMERKDQKKMARHAREGV